MANVTGPSSSSIGHLATWSDTTGSSVADGGVVPVGWFNVLDYGADKTGANDSTIAVTNAIAAATSGGVVYFPAGIYKISSITMASGFTNILGDGIFATILSPSSTTGNFITLSGGHQSVSNLAIQASVKRTSGDTIYVDSGAVTIQNIQIYSSGSDGFFNGIHFAATSAGQFTLTNFLINQCSNAAIQLADPSSTSQVVGGSIYNGTIGSSGNGVLIYNTGGLNVSDLDIITSASHGVIIYPSSGQNPFALYFLNVLCDTCGSDGWLISANGGNVGDVNLIGCWGSSNGGFGLNISGLTAPSVNGVLVSGGDYIANDAGGIMLGECVNVILSGIQVYNNSQGGSGRSSGISIATGVSEFQIVNCVSGIGGHTQQEGYPAYQNYGIYVSPGSSNNYIIQGNRCPGNLTAGVLDSGTGTSKFVGNNLSS